MNRRLFVGQCAAGLALQLAPSLLIASPLSPARTDQQSNTNFVHKAASLIQQGSLGTTQRLTITHIYSSTHTSLATLLAKAPHDFSLVNQLVNADLTIDYKHLSILTPSADWGSHSARLDVLNLSIIWQALARVGMPTSALTSTLHVMGSEGIMHLNLSKLSYKLVDFRGRIVHSEN